MSDQAMTRRAEPELFVVGDDGGVHLVVSRCARCASPWFPARAVCGSCGSAEVTAERVGPEGTVYASTMVRIGPPAFETPYCLAYLDVDGLRVLAPVQAEGRSASGSLAPGTPVRLVAGAVGDSAVPTYVARPPIDGGDHDA
ncbi:OB-fold domain-containing protein [Nocardioides sp. LHD-245]|uniref:Zn-ribbon domain-containing OB-fold protein n=1 Tax=Nocardioides sp. LHD-245 TaxID=3051387 RepID=UPI0027E08F45|nr:OB-fold domain-containing protein [Nocardioides sp. LHD-245]